MKGQRGITLIALIITVIVLLILAGVAISSLGPNGIFSRASTAANAYNDSVHQEETNTNNAIDLLNDTMTNMGY